MLSPGRGEPPCSSKADREVLLLSWWLPQVAMVVALLCLLLIGVGCSVEVGRKNDLPTSPKKERVLETGAGTWDLRTPPSREEAGMPPGETVVIYDRHGGWWDATLIRARVLLPEGKRLEVEASNVAFDSYGAPCSQRAGKSAPTTMDISVGPVPLDDARRELVRAADEFGFSRPYVEEWYSESKKAVEQGDATDWIKTPFLRSEVGYLTAEVRGSFLPYEHEVEHAFVHYIFSWAKPFDPSACERLEETTGRSGRT